jgi:aminopeptidase N
VVHETAHQWFGDSVTESDWNDVWLSEGFATYFTLLFTEHDEGRDGFVRGLALSRAQVLELEQKLPDTPVIHRNLADMQHVLNRLIYQKGGWVLHMLRAEIGTEPFWQGIREYYRRYQDGNASTADLRAVMEQVSARPLDWFFAQWLTRPGVPRIEGTWRYDAARKMVDVTVTQSQAADPYRLTVEIGVTDTAGAPPRVTRVELTGRQATTSLPADAAPVAVSLDPGTWLLMDAGPLTRRP